MIQTQGIVMAVTLLHGIGNLVCDGVDVGGVEFSIASPEDGPDVTRRGKVWGEQKGSCSSNERHQDRTCRA